MAAWVTFLALAISAHGVQPRRSQNNSTTKQWNRESKHICRSEEDLYRTHLYSSYLQHRLPSLNTLTSSAKRGVKLSQEGLFYHDGAYTSHK